MKTKLMIQGLIKMLSGILLMGLLLFLPAGTFNFPRAWLMMVVLFVPMLIVGTYLLIKNPKLLEKRLNTKETEKEQKLVILLSSIMFILAFLLSAFDYKYNWFQLPTIISVIGCVVFILTYLGFIELLKENEYLSRTVEVQEGQKVVDTGMYGIVRHPMYSIIFFMFISMPIILGSLIGLIPLIGLPIILIIRIKNEEANANQIAYMNGLQRIANEQI